MNYITVDIETNGVSPKNDDILLISAVKIINGEICDTFSKLVKPLRPQTEELELFTNITNKELEYAESLETVIKDFAEFAEGCTVVSYDEFEYNFLNYKGFSSDNVIYLREYIKKNYPQIEKYIADAVIYALGLEKDLKVLVNSPMFYKKTRLFYALKVACIFTFVAGTHFEI